MAIRAAFCTRCICEIMVVILRLMLRKMNAAPKTTFQRKFRNFRWNHFSTSGFLSRQLPVRSPSRSPPQRGQAAAKDDPDDKPHRRLTCSRSKDRLFLYLCYRWSA